MQGHEFAPLLQKFFSAFPRSLRDGNIPPSIQNAYWEVLKNEQIDDVRQALRHLMRTGGDFVPSAALVLSHTRKFATDRNPAAYHNERPQQASDDPDRQLPAFTGDGLPKSSRQMPPQVGRRESDYSQAAHDATDHFLNLIRAMKFKGLPGGEMADRFIAEMHKAGPKKSSAPAPYQERVRAGFIPNAADATCAEFADHLAKVRAGSLPGDREPTDIGGRMFWTFSARQKQHISQKIGEAKAWREKREKEQTTTDTQKRGMQFSNKKEDQKKTVDLPARHAPSGQKHATVPPDQGGDKDPTWN